MKLTLLTSIRTDNISKCDMFLIPFRSLDAIFYSFFASQQNSIKLLNKYLAH